MSNDAFDATMKMCFSQPKPLHTFNNIVPKGKTNSNVVYIYPQFYALAPINELGLDQNITDTNKTLK